MESQRNLAENRLFTNFQNKNFEDDEKKIIPNAVHRVKKDRYRNAVKASVEMYFVLPELEIHGNGGVKGIKKYRAYFIILDGTQYSGGYVYEE